MAPVGGPGLHFLGHSTVRVELAGHTVLTETGSFFFLALVLDAYAIAAQTLVGQALGAARPDEARQTALRVTLWGLGTGIVIAVLLLALRGMAERRGLVDEDLGCERQHPVHRVAVEAWVRLADITTGVAIVADVGALAVDIAKLLDLTSDKARAAGMTW